LEEELTRQSRKIWKRNLQTKVISHLNCESNLCIKSKEMSAFIYEVSKSLDYVSVGFLVLV